MTQIIKHIMVQIDEGYLFGVAFLLIKKPKLNLKKVLILFGFKIIINSTICCGIAYHNNLYFD